MPIPEVSYSWALTSTGAGSIFGSGSTTAGADSEYLRNCRNITVTAHTQTGATASTASFGVEVAANATAPFVRFGSTEYHLSSNGDAAVLQFPGPLRAIRPYYISRDASTTILTVTLTGN